MESSLPGASKRASQRGSVDRSKCEAKASVHCADGGNAEHRVEKPLLLESEVGMHDPVQAQVGEADFSDAPNRRVGSNAAFVPARSI